MKKLMTIVGVFVLCFSMTVSAKKKKKNNKFLLDDGSLCQTLKGEPNITVCVNGEVDMANLSREQLRKVKLVASGLTKKLSQKFATTAKFTVTDPYYPGYSEPTYTEDTTTSTDPTTDATYEYPDDTTTTDTTVDDTMTYEYNTPTFEDDPDAFCAETYNQSTNECTCYLHGVGCGNESDPNCVPSCMAADPTMTTEMCESMCAAP